MSDILGKQTSTERIAILNSTDRELRELTKAFAKLAKDTSVHIVCFFETKQTEILRRFLKSKIKNTVSRILRRKTKKIVKWSLLARL